MKKESHRKPRRRPGRLASILGLLLIALLLPLSVWAQGEIASLNITNLDSSDFPRITLQVLARDSLGGPLQALGVEQIQLSENNEPQTIETIETVQAGVRLAVVVDPGDGSFNTGVTLRDVYAYMLQDLRLFALDRPWMLAGVDELLLLVQEGESSVVVVPPMADPESWFATADAYAAPSGVATEAEEYGDYTRAALMTALKELKLARPDGPDLAEAILLYTPGMRADLADVAQEAIGLGIPIYIILCRPDETTYWSEALPPLAEVTGGEFIATYENEDPERLFEDIVARRTQFHLIYESSLASVGKRRLRLEVVGAPEPIMATSSYSMDLLPPQVELISPTVELIERGGSEDPAQAEPAFVTVVARVTWPDGSPRAIQAARLLVDGIAVGQAALSQDQVEIAWDIRAFQSESWTPVSLQVEMMDEFGLRGVSEPVNLAIQYAPPESKGWSWPENILLYVAIGVALLALGVALFLFFNRERMGGAWQEARDNVADFVERVTGRRTALVASAFLVPLEGFDEKPSKSYEIYGTTAIGRSRRHADLLFHIGEDDSPISRLHCTILDEDDRLALRDEDSSNGTYVNGEQLRPLQAVTLHDGDIIDIAPLERGGVRLMFQLARADGEQPGGDEPVRMTQPKRKPERDSNW